MNYSDSELLQYLLSSGTIDLATILNDVAMKEKEKYISQHKCPIWETKDGKYITYVPDENCRNKRRLLKRKTRSDLEDAICEFYKKGNHIHTFKESFDTWIKRKLEYGEILKQTYDRYIYEYNRYIYNTELDRMDISKVKTDFLEDYIKGSISTHKMTAKRFNIFKGIIIGTFKTAKRNGYTDFSIVEFFDEIELSKRVFSKSIKTEEQEVFTSEEVKLIEEYVNYNAFSMTNMAILFALQTGLRAGELSALTFDDIKGNILSVTKTEERFKDDNGHYVKVIREMTKGREGHRNVILTPKALELIDVVAANSKSRGYLFNTNGKRITGNNISMKLTRICKTLGIIPRSLHKVRKTYATYLLNAGIDEKIIESQMGHTDISTTRKYYYFNNHSREEVAEAITSAVKW